MRTASTFQWYLLCSILRVKSRSWRDAKTSCHYGEPLEDEYINASQVIKGHTLGGIPNRPRTFLFVSRGRSVSVGMGAKFNQRFAPDVSDKGLEKFAKLNRHIQVVHAQDYTDFVRQGLGLIWLKYKPMFNLSDSETAQVAMHMKLWSVLRVCCGPQASIDHLMSTLSRNKSDVPHLHGREDPDSPSCEFYNLGAIESAFLQTTLGQAHPDELYINAKTCPKGKCQTTPANYITANSCARANAKLRARGDPTTRAVMTRMQNLQTNHSHHENAEQVQER